MSHYRIVRLVPDAVVEEFINVGVVAYEGCEVQIRFLVNWDRARSFAGSAVEAALSCLRQLRDSPPSDGGDLDRIAERFNRAGGAIQFSEPRASILSVSNLLQQVADLFLKG